MFRARFVNVRNIVLPPKTRYYSHVLALKVLNYLSLPAFFNKRDRVIRLLGKKNVQSTLFNLIS